MTDENSDAAHSNNVPETVLVCVNRRFRGDQPSCAARGSEEVAAALETGIKERNIAVNLERSICMGQCTKGPTVRFAPKGRFNLPTKLSDVPELLDELESLCGKNEDTNDIPLHLLGT